MTAHARRVTNRELVAGVLVGLARRLADGTQRRQVLKALWIEAKRHGARRVVNVETSRIDGLGSVNVHGSPARYCTLVLTALAMLLRCERIFEIGTFRGDTSWLLAHNLPTARVYTLDLPGPDAVATAKLDLTDPEYFASWDRGARFHGTPESARIVQLFGDAAAFDFTPYRGAMDLVFVDASHSYSYVRSDTEAALTMLSETGTIVWDDYTHYAGIHAYLNELAPSLDRPIYHLLGTRLALYSRADRLSPQNWK